MRGLTRALCPRGVLPERVGVREHGPVRRQAVQATALAVGVAAASALFVLLCRAADVRLVTGDGSGQIALDSVAATIGLLLAFLLYGRFLDSRQQGDALLS